MSKALKPPAAGSTLSRHLGPVPCNLDGGVAQLGERLPCTQEVIGSIPFTSTIRFQVPGDRCQKHYVLMSGFTLFCS